MNCLTSERFNSDESLVNFSHLEKIHTFKKFCSGEYLSHLQKIQLFGRFDCGESLEYFSHLLNISHICKDSDIQKIPLPENTILSLGQNLNIIFSTSLHFHCLPYFMPLLATSLHLPFCLSHFTPPVIFASLHLTSRHFTSPPILSTSIHANSLCLLFSSHHFTSLHATSLCLTFFLHHFTSLCATLLCLTSLFPASLHATSLHLTLSTSLHATLCHFTSPPVL